MAESRTKPDKAQKRKWALSELWKKLHFGHIASGKKEDSWKGMEAAYRFGLDPFRKHLLAQISARIKRKKLMTYKTEEPTLSPVRLELICHGTIVSRQTDGATRKLSETGLRIW